MPKPPKNNISKMILDDFEVQVGSKHRPNIDLKTEPKMGCILASVFDRFLLIWGAMLGGKIEQKSIKNGIEKTIEKRRAARWPTRRSKSLRHRGAPWARAQGEGVGGEVKTTLATRAVAHSHPPTQHISLGRWENSRKPT